MNRTDERTMRTDKSTECTPFSEHNFMGNAEQETYSCTICGYWVIG